MSGLGAVGRKHSTEADNSPVGFVANLFMCFSSAGEFPAASRGVFVPARWRRRPHQLWLHPLGAVFVLIVEVGKIVGVRRLTTEEFMSGVMGWLAGPAS